MIAKTFEYEKFFMFSLALNQAFVNFVKSVDTFSCNVPQRLKAFQNYIESRKS